MRKVFVCIIAFALFTAALPQQAACAKAMPLSSDTFTSTSISVSISGSANFSALVRYPCTISVSNCTLQKQVNGRWVFAASLTPPPSKANTVRYSAKKDYSSDMASGVTYRIVATFSADGESVIATSGSITY